MPDPTKSALTAALKETVRALELWLEHCDGEYCDARVYDAYVEARTLLGRPPRFYPGGREGTHYHFLEFDPERDTCYWCEQYEEEREEDPWLISTSAT